MPTDTPTLAWLGAAAFMLLWNVLLAGQIAQARRQQPDLLALTALCGLLIVPATIIALAAPLVHTGRTVAWVSWLWPVTLFLFVLQSGLALWRGVVTSLIAVPILAANVLLCTAAAARHAALWWPGIPEWWLATGTAHLGVLGALLGPDALASPLALQLPLLVPAYPARWQLSKAVRAALALGATATTLAMVIEYPAAARALATFPGLASMPLRARPQGDLALGVRILPTLGGPPSEVALERDLRVADTLTARVLAVTLRPSGASALTLDSLANSLAALRRDSVALLVTLGYDPGDKLAFAADAEGVRTRRLALVERIVRRLRPDVLVPAADPILLGEAALGPVSQRWWTDYFTRAARLAHQLRPRTLVALTASAWTPADSVLFAWGARSGDIDVLGYSFAPSFGGGASLLARLRVADRWSAGVGKPQWVVAARSYPGAFGERAQVEALSGIFAWASRHSRVRAVVVDGAGDHDAVIGLQRADGHLRPAVAALAAANRALQDATLALR